MRYINKDIENPIVLDTIKRLKSSRTYNEDTIVYDNLRKVYGECCAYCESKIGIESYPQLDHFYPKRKSGQYAEYNKDIHNLHYSCQRCNLLKGAQVKEIFSPNWYLNNQGVWTLTNPDKIETELYYVGHLLYSRNIVTGSEDRGDNTIKLFNLNNNRGSIRGHRAYLIENRLRTLHAAYCYIKTLTALLQNYSEVINPIIELQLKQLVEMTHVNSEYSTMVLHNYGDLIIKLLKIYSKKKTTQ